MRKINIANDKKRDALIGFELNRTKDSCHYRTASGEEVSSGRFLRYSGETAAEKLFVRYVDFENFCRQSKGFETRNGGFV